MIEITGAGAVLIGLIFVGLELRQNTEAVQAATMQSITESSNEYFALIVSNPEVAKLDFLKASTGPVELDEVQTHQYSALVRWQLFRYQNAFLQWRRGALSEDDWSVYEHLICRINSEPAGPFAVWQGHRDSLSKSFVTFVENCRAKFN